MGQECEKSNRRPVNGCYVAERPQIRFLHAAPAADLRGESWKRNGKDTIQENHLRYLRDHHRTVIQADRGRWEQAAQYELRKGLVNLTDDVAETVVAAEC